MWLMQLCLIYFTQEDSSRTYYYQYCLVTQLVHWVHSSFDERSMCFRYGAAEVDCSQSIVLDPTYVKAYARRGTARHLMGKLEEAKKDFQRVLSLEPANKQAQQDLDVIDKVEYPRYMTC